MAVAKAGCCVRVRKGAAPRAWAEVTVGPYSAHEFDACVGHYVKRGVLPAHQGPKTFDARRLKISVSVKGKKGPNKLELPTAGYQCSLKKCTEERKMRN